MAFRRMVGASVLAAGFVVFVGVARAEEEAKRPAGQPSQEEMMQAWAQMNQLGPQHAEFKNAVGKWKHTSKFWMQPGEPTVAEGTSVMTLELGGRYLREEYTCGMFGMPFKGVSLTGYDTMTKKYVSIWYDNMSTGIMRMEGEADPETKVVTLYSAEYEDPFKGKGKMKSTLKHVSDDEVAMEMFWIGADGNEHKEMEIHYTRVKPGEEG